MYKNFLASCLKELYQIVPNNLYLVGGSIREVLLNKDSYDYDFIVLDNAIEICKVLASKTKGALVPLDKERDIGRVVWNINRNNFDLVFDISKLVGNSLEEDLKKRDITFNSLALEINSENINKLINNDFSELNLIDVSDGYKDLKNKKVRTLAIENLIDDPLRMLRVFRFSTKLGFEIEESTLGYIKEKSNLIKKVSKERVLKELYDIFDFTCYKNIQEMNSVGFLSNIFSDFGIFDKDIFKEGIENIKIFETNFIDNNFSYSKDINVYLDDFLILNRSRSSLIKIILLFHSLMKSSKENNLDKLDKFLKLFTFSAVEQKTILKVLKYLLFEDIVINKEITRKNLFSFFYTLKNEVLMILIIIKVLNISSFEIQEKLEKILFYYMEDKILSVQPKIIDGNDIMKEFNFSGKDVGLVLDLIREAQAEKIISNYNEAIDFIKNNHLKG